MKDAASIRLASLGWSSWIAEVLLVASWVTGSAAGAWEPATIERGFKPERAFQVGEIDHVRLLNGGLELAIPLSGRYPLGGAGMSYGFTLHFSGQLWDYSQNFVPPNQYATGAYPVRKSSAGFGWRLSLGELWINQTGPNGCALCYVGPDGSRHVFTERLHPDVPPQAGVLFTTDGTYLRLRDIGGGFRELDFPSGETHRFDAAGRLVEAWDPFGNGYAITYLADSWTLLDTEGRIQTVQLTDVPNYGKAVSTLQLTAFGGATATYTFTYDSVQVPRSCLDDDANTSATLLLPLLTGVAMPHGMSYGVPLAGYYLVPESCPNGTPRQGLPQTVVLPTLGSVEWEFTRYEFPVPIELIDQEDDPPTWLSGVTGVWKRRLRRASGEVEGEWIYTQTLPFGSESEESITTVQTPLGDRSEHFFNVGKTQSLRYGLPYTPLSTHPVRNDLFLSNRVYDCDASGGNCAVKRSTYLKYRTDGPGLGLLELNPDVEASLTRFHDDSDRYAAVDFSDADGLGHFRQEVTSGNYGSGDVRSTFTAFNPSAGTYPGSFVPPPAGGPWILGTFARVDLTEEGVTARTEHCFDDSTGFLRRTRALASGTSRGAHDLLAVFQPGAVGERAAELDFGGDAQAIDTDPATPLCSMALPAAAAYEVRDTWSHGALATSRYFDDGDPMPFLSLDREIDAATGLVARSRDVSGLATDSEYDLLGRLTWVKPALGHDGWTELQYTPATSPASLAGLRVLRRGNGSATAPVMAESSYDFDSFGRVAVEARRMPGVEVWSTRETSYDANGWRASVSEWGHPTQRTTFTGYDPFGRAATITPPDGTDHRVELEYLGDRQVLRRTRVGTTAGKSSRAIEEPSETIERYDRQGRLHQVMEPSGMADANVTTTYSYDVGGRLRQAETTALVSGLPVTQTRTWTYDQRGFLLSEQHPEKGEMGQGEALYSDYDARGHAGRKIDGPFDLTFQWDAAERLEEVWQTGTPSRLLKQYVYGSMPGSSLGRLVTAGRFNYAVIEGEPVTVRVRESDEHLGRGGRISGRTTEVFLNEDPDPSHRWIESFEYTPLGEIDRIEYPYCAAGGCVGASSFPEVEYLFARGWLTTVQTPSGAPYASVAYHGNGMVATVAHVNGVTDSYGEDPHGMSRPAWISATGVTSGGDWSTGAYHYDGAGNVVEIGESSYLYDRVSRVVAAQVSLAGPSPLIFADDFESGDTSAWGAPPAPPTRSQEFEYDPFGNLVEIQGTPGQVIPVNPATNRLVGPTYAYDEAGNLTRWNGNVYEYGPFGEVTRVVASTEEWLHAYTAGDERLFSWQVGGEQRLRWTLRGLDGRVLREYVANRATGVGWVERDNFYRGAGGPLLLSQGFAQGPVQTTHYHVDHLGTPRLLTDVNGAAVAFHAYFPYGEEATDPAQDRIRYKFTGHERDLGDPASTEDDLDHMHARMANPQLGRFLSTDPAGGNPKSPQTWNRYAYVLGNPLKFVDPTGELTFLVIYGKGYLATDLAGGDSDVGRLFEHAARTRVREIQASDRYDPHRDEVVLREVGTREQLVRTVNADYPSGEISSIDIFSHGYIGGLNFGEGPSMSREKNLQVSQVGELRPRLAPSAKATLYGCDTGRGQPSLAEAISKHLGIPVTAPTSYTWFTNTTPTPQNPDVYQVPQGGAMTTFWP